MRVANGLCGSLEPAVLILMRVSLAAIAELLGASVSAVVGRGLHGVAGSRAPGLLAAETRPERRCHTAAAN